MIVSLDTQMVLVCRTEVEKTPKIVYAHEIPLLQLIHGKQRIELIDAKSPLGRQDVDLELEFTRLMDEYALATDENGEHPLIKLYGDYEGFESAIEAPKTKPRIKKAE